MLRSVSAVVIALLIVTTAAATDLRGRIDGLHQYSPNPFPVSRVTVVLVIASANQSRIIASSVSGQDGMYYFRGIAPGNYLLVVNNLRFPISVRPQAWQDIPPIVLRF